MNMDGCVSNCRLVNWPCKESPTDNMVHKAQKNLGTLHFIPSGLELKLNRTTELSIYGTHSFLPEHHIHDNLSPLEQQCDPI